MDAVATMAVGPIAVEDGGDWVGGDDFFSSQEMMPQTKLAQITKGIDVFMNHPLDV